MKRKVILGGAVAVILVASLIAGIYLLPSGQTGSATSSSSHVGTTTTSPADPLTDFGVPTSSIPVGAAPYGIAYDPLSGDAFVAVSGSDSVAVIGNGGNVIGNVSLGGAADFLAFDPSDSLLYASLIANNSVSIINTTLDAVVSTVAVGTSPGWLAYDPASGTVYAVNREVNVVSVISGASVVSSITLDGLPFAVAYNPSDEDMYVTNNAGAVFIINGTSNSLIDTLQVGGVSSDLLGIAYSSTYQRMYVTSYSDNEVYIVNGSRVEGSIGGFNAPIGIAFSTTTSEMFVVNSGNDTVSASWSGNSSTVSVGSSPREVVFDPSIGAIVVTNYGGSTLSVVSA
jgi:YVTN family beta-propeller protein